MSVPIPDVSQEQIERPLEKRPTIHPLWLRFTHWLNALAVVVMVGSGWQIYNASPLFGFRFPSEITLGGWLAGGLDWHFAAMWVLVINGLIYLFFNGVSGRLWRKFLPLSFRGVFNDAKAAFQGRLSHADLGRYNFVQKAAYLLVVVDLMVLVLSGLVLWKSVQFPLLTALLGGYDSARYVHFFSMLIVLGFIFIHVLMVLLVPRSLWAMIRGR
ncbi:MAG: cytochrome B [Halothiobacillus sp. 24-54-40]|jgi:thiosulfate reductase cytochrome b subunit|nr:MAG: cytochrome B [Halothiobacillus sp. 35-54-62]OYY56832.1 MAG: cytochrome B [Halothiobacillus sp. 28-55-5]OYZ86573.1 MAG: cytochrome B [Halothiobacillus sp. 24-54-40]OZA79134.1 MAG: cytochrome B [Halothiobacillus sp. 39-53-45]HQS03560.1 cytochrome b/b6 domain-containing protein [Halothiobacillus sp.]